MRFLTLLLCVSAFAVNASAQVNIYNPGCLANGTDQTSCFQNAFVNHQTVAVDPGNYTLAGPLVLQTWQTLIGAGPTQTILYFTNSSKAGIVFASQNATPSSNLGGGLGGLRHLTVYGPAYQSPPDMTHPSEPIGIYLGGDSRYSTSNYYGDNVRFEDIVVLGFITGVQIGQNAYSDAFTNSRLESNLTDVFAPPAVSNSGEKMVFSNCQFYNTGSGIVDQTGFEWMIDNSTFDFLSGTAITVSGNNPLGTHVNISHSHFETGTLPPNGFISSSGPATVSVQDTTFLVNKSDGSATAMINTSSQTVQVNVVGGYADSQRQLYFVNTAKSVWLQSVAGNPSAHLTAINVAPHPALVTNMFGGAFASPE